MFTTGLIVYSTIIKILQWCDVICAEMPLHLTANIFKMPEPIYINFDMLYCYSVIAIKYLYIIRICEHCCYRIFKAIFRLTPPSWPNKVGLRCPSVRPSVHNKFLWFQWNLVCRYRSMPDAWWYAVWPDPRLRSGHEPLKVGNSAIFNGYLFPHL